MVTGCQLCMLETSSLSGLVSDARSIILKYHIIIECRMREMFRNNATFWEDTWIMLLENGLTTVKPHDQGSVTSFWMVDLSKFQVLKGWSWSIKVHWFVMFLRQNFIFSITPSLPGCVIFKVRSNLIKIVLSWNEGGGNFGSQLSRRTRNTHGERKRGCSYQRMKSPACKWERERERERERRRYASISQDNLGSRRIYRW